MQSLKDNAGQSVVRPKGRQFTARFMPGLDGLRGLAIISVLFFHGCGLGQIRYTGAKSGIGYALMVIADHGWLGVPLFFVLSGFLITGILLRTSDRRRFYQNFYWRRALRILPLYLVVLALVKVDGIVSWRQLLSALLFTANMPHLLKMSAIGYGTIWSLAVEEQFYLIWPTLVKKFTLPVLTWIILAALVGCTVYTGFAERGPSDTYYKTLPNFVYLLSGALLSALVQRGVIHTANATKTMKCILAVGVMSLVPYVMLVDADRTTRLSIGLWAALSRFTPTLFFVAAILYAVYRAEFPKERGAGMQAVLGVASFFGYISYGLYLIHPLMFTLYDEWVTGTGLAEYHASFSALLLRFCFVAPFAVAIALGSRRYFEEPFLKAKKQMAPSKKEASSFANA